MVRVPAPTMAVSRADAGLGIAIEFLARFYLACREAGNKIEIEIKASPLPYNNSLKPAQVRAGCSSRCWDHADSKAYAGKVVGGKERSSWLARHAHGQGPGPVRLVNRLRCD